MNRNMSINSIKSKSFALLWLVFAIACMLVVPLNGAFRITDWGARPAGMGGAFTASGDDVSSALYNPANFGRVKAFDSTFMFAKLFSGLDSTDLRLYHFGMVYPMKTGSVGINWANFTSPYLYSEDTISFTYARRLNPVIDKLIRINAYYDFFIGLSLKYLRHSFSLDRRTEEDIVFSNGDSKDAVTFDLGVLNEFPVTRNSFLAMGIAVKNITQPDVGLRTSDSVPMEIRFGAAYKLAQFYKVKNLNMCADASYRNSNGSVNNRINIHLGSEAWLFDEAVGLRIGGNRSEVSTGFSIKKKLNNYKIKMDYAFLWPIYIRTNVFSHRIALSVGF